MSFARSARRAAAVSAVAAGLVVAASGAAHATTPSAPAVDGNTVSVTFTLDTGQLADACGAVLTPTAAAAGVADRLTNGDLSELLGIINGESDTIVLKDGALPVAPLALVGKPSATVTASDVPSNLYSLVTVCMSNRTPKITPFVPVGDPFSVITGSLGTASEGDNLTAGSSLLGKGLEAGLFG